MQKSFVSLLFSAFAAAILLAGCAAPPQLPRIFWPPPPNTPRLEFVGAYASQDDFPKTGNQLFAEKIVGKPPLAVFRSPFGIAADGKGKAYISDIHDRNIRVYDLRAYTVNYLSKEPVFTLPLGLALDGDGNLYVADGGKQQVLVFSPQGKPLFAFGDGSLFENPAYLAINKRLGRLYVSDGRGHKIVAFDLQGRHLFSFGELGNAEGTFRAPQGMAIDAEDRLFVADMLNARVQVFDADGKYLYSFGERGDKAYQFEAPKDLAFDSDGNLYVVDARRSFIATFTPEGKLLLTTGSNARTMHKLGYSRPASVFVAPDDRIYVADTLNKRFSVWQYLNEEYLQEHPVSTQDIEKLKGLMRKP